MAATNAAKNGEYAIKSVGTLIPYINNSRTHSDEQVAQIAASIKEFGFTNPILIDEDNSIIAGHGRLLAARQLDLTEVPAITLLNLTEAQKKAYVIADNQLASNADWDLDLLKLEVENLQELDFDIGLLGFDDNFIDGLLEVEPTEGLTDEDDVPEPPADPITVEGDLWILGNHRLLCGDSTSIDAVDKLKDGQKADFCFTSPPYNADRGKGHKSDRLGGNGFYGDGYEDSKTSDEYIQFNTDVISAIESASNDNFTCCYNINYNKNSPSEYIDVIAAAKRHIPLIETIVWEKAMAISLQGDNLTRIYEFIFVLAKGKFKINKNRTECLKNLWKISNSGANHEQHKACFPIALVEEGIKNFCPHGGRVIEPFGGTGTTMIAAEKMGCKSNLMELDPKYCDVIIARWQDFTGQEAVLENGDTYNKMKNEREAA